MPGERRFCRPCWQGATNEGTNGNGPRMISWPAGSGERAAVTLVELAQSVRWAHAPVYVRAGDLSRSNRGTRHHFAHPAPRTPPFAGPVVSGYPSGPHPLPPPSCCLPPSRPATWHFLSAEAEAPPQLPARPVPAGRGPQTRGCPLAAGCAPRRAAPPDPALAIPFPAGRTYVRRGASRGQGSRCTRPGEGPSPRAFAWVPGIFTRSLNCKLVRPQPRGFGTHRTLPPRFSEAASALRRRTESQRGPPRARAPPRGFPDAGWGATCGLGRPDSGAPGCLHFTPPAPGCFHVTVLERLS